MVIKKKRYGEPKVMRLGDVKVEKPSTASPPSSSTPSRTRPKIKPMRRLAQLARLGLKESKVKVHRKKHCRRKTSHKNRKK